MPQSSGDDICTLERSITMAKILNAKSTIVVTGALLLASVAGISNAKAAQDGAPDAHEQARLLLQRPAITPASSAAATFATFTAQTVVPDAHEQARRLLSRGNTDAGKIPAAPGRVASLETATLDAHLQAERLLSR
jgi:hypothetical protein